VLAIVSAVVLIAAGAGLLVPKVARLAAIVLAIDYALWVVVLHGPRVVAHPAAIPMWLGVAEILQLAIGATLLATGIGPRHRPERWRALRIAYGSCALVFGLSHFVYAQFTAGMVPGWLPGALFWAYATGIGHTATGLAFVAGVMERWAAPLFAAMLGSFVLLVHVPRVLAAPNVHAEWAMLAIALSLNGAAIVFAKAVQHGRAD
jgi:uncharacterized membrane protein YphA (DoxX/SURF4 family)